MSMIKDKDRVCLVGHIDDSIWNALSESEKNLLFVIGDAMDKRFDTQEMRKRLDAIYRQQLIIGHEKVIEKLRNRR